MKKKTIPLIILGIITLLIAIIVASWAYFISGSINTTNNTELIGSTGDAIPISLVTIGDTVSLNITQESMLEVNKSNLPVAKDDGTLEVRLTAGSEETPIYCEYDLYYKYVINENTTTYTRSDDTQKEFTYGLYKNNILVTKEDNFVNTTSTPQK